MLSRLKTATRNYKGLSKYGNKLDKNPKDFLNNSHNHTRVLKVIREDDNKVPAIKLIGQATQNRQNPNVTSTAGVMKGNGKLGWSQKNKFGRIKMKPVRVKDVDKIRSMAHIDQDFEEKVLKIERDGMATYHIALVAGTYPHAKQRWIVAPHTIKVGDVMRTWTYKPKTNTFPSPVIEGGIKQGDAYPLGSLPVGTAVCLIAPSESQDSDFTKIWAGEAGSHMFVFKQFPEHHKTFCYYPSFKRTVEFSNRDIAVIGRVSNPGHSQEVRQPKSEKEKSYLGIAHAGKRYSRPDARYARTRPDDTQGKKSLFPKIYMEPIDTTIVQGASHERVSGPDSFVKEYLRQKDGSKQAEILEELERNQVAAMEKLAELGDLDEETQELMRTIRM